MFGSSHDGEPQGRIAIDATSQVIGGGVTVARDLAGAMARERPGTRFAFFCSIEPLARGPYPGNVEVVYRPELAGLGRRIGWEQRRLPGILRNGGYDVLLNLGGFAILRCPVPQVSVWQNPNIFTRIPVPRSFSLDAYIGFQRLVQRVSMRRADMNVFLTEDSLGEAGTRWDIRRIPHVVIHHGVPELPRPAPDAQLPSEPFVLAVGHSYFHKNYEVLIDAVGRYRERFGEPPLVWIAGGAVDDAYHATLLERVRDRGLEGRVRFLGAQPPERVAALYAGAAAYVTTSVLESFGLTPLEAMARETPVLAGEASCIPEVCGDAALYCDPRDPDDVALKLRRVLEDESLRSQLVERGRLRVKRFSWAESAQRYLVAIDACLAEATPASAARSAARSIG